MGRRSLPRRADLVAVGIAVALVMAGAVACTADNGSASIGVRNDLSHTVTFAMCNSLDCSKIIRPSVVRPGGVVTVQVGISSGYSPAVIRNSAQKPIGCLPFHLTKRPPAHDVVDMSTAVPCGSTGGLPPG